MKQHATKIVLIMVVLIFAFASLAISAEKKSKRSKHNKDFYSKKVKVLGTYRVYINLGHETVTSDDLSDPKHDYEFCIGYSYWPEGSHSPHGDLLFVRTFIGSDEELKAAQLRLITAVEINGNFKLNDDEKNEGSHSFWATETTISARILAFKPIK